MRHFTAEELDRMGQVVHACSFVEQYDSGERNPLTGKQERKFRCMHCGKRRTVTIPQPDADPKES